MLNTDNLIMRYFISTINHTHLHAQTIMMMMMMMTLTMHSIPAGPLLAEIAGDPGRTRLEPSAGGWSSSAYLKGIYRQSELVIGTF